MTDIAAIEVQPDLITVGQIRSAKAVLGLSNLQLQAATGLHRNTLSRLDAGDCSAKTLRILRIFFEGKGVVFIRIPSGQRGILFEPDLCQSI